MKKTYFNFYFFGLICLLSGCVQIVENRSSKTADIVSGTTYDEPHRPQFHFSPKEKWMNDPNGMFFYEGEYHLFYQFYPDSTVWGPMHWGHAISEDLVHWEHLPIALYPDSLGYIFSGSAVVDWENTSGFSNNDQPPIIAIFTHHDPIKEKAGQQNFQYQSIAYSNDRGRSWQKFEGNPVVPNVEQIRDFRDPKVVWDPNSDQWIMVFAAFDHIKIYGSNNLKDWTHLSDWGKQYGEHGGVWECPDLFPMKVEGTNETKWVLLQSLNPGSPNGGSGTQYFIGSFDGTKFNLDPLFEKLVNNGEGVWIDYGRDNYAGVTWSDIPKSDGRRIFIGWMSNWDYATIVPTQVWRSANTLPRELTLTKIQGSYQIHSTPVEELKLLRQAEFPIQDPGENEEVVLAESPDQLELELEIEIMGDEAEFGILLSNESGESYRIGYEHLNKRFFSDRTKAGNHAFSEKFASEVHFAPRLSTSKILHLNIFFDRSSVELFADGGSTVITDIVFPTEKFSELKMYKNGGVELKEGVGYTLNSIWQ